MRYRALLAAGIVAVAGVAVAPRPTPPAGAVPAPPMAAAVETLPFSATASDGTVLRGHVFLPRRGEPLATVLDLSPYWNTAAFGPSGVSLPANPEGQHARLAPFLQAGFAVAAVNLRGTGSSDGCFQWGGRVDWSDAATVVETLARQPWSNGTVGMYGVSYDAWAQYMAVAAAPPALKAVVPVSGVIDVWSLLTRRGAVINEGAAVSTAWRTLFSFAATDAHAAGHAACQAETEADSRANAELVRTGDRTEYFEHRDLRPFIAGTDVAVFATNGMVRYEEGHILQYDHLWERLRPDRSRLLIGQWGHGEPTTPGWPAPAVAWFDHYLRGGPQAVEPGVVDYQDDSGGWNHAPRWPPPGTPAALYLSGATLTSAPPQVETTAEALPPGAADPGLICGPLQTLSTSPPVVEDVLLAGSFTLDATLTTTEPGGNLVTVLYRTAGDGTCADLTAHGHEIGRAQLDLRHWLHPGSSRDFPVDRPTSISIEGEPFASLLHAGERLVLAIGTGSAELMPDPYQPAVSVTSGPARPAFLTLPVTHGTLRFQTGGAR